MRTLVSHAGFCLALAAASLCATPMANAAGYAYRGSLEREGAPADGTFRFRFGLYDRADGGRLLAAPIEVDGVTVRGGAFAAELELGALLERAEARLGPGAALDLSRDVIVALTCPACGHAAPGRAVLGAVRESQAACPRCGAHRVVETASSIRRDGGVDLALTPADLGLPPFDVIVARQGLERQEAWLFDGDVNEALGPLAGSYGRGPA
jgi:predicted RNA-binding Zn-ribbon protein involved in translation (DUF1610 family)